MITIKTNQKKDAYGLEKIFYKIGRRTAAEISLPNEYNGHKYSAHIHVTRCGGVGGSFDTLEAAKEALSRYFKGYYFDNVVIN